MKVCVIQPKYSFDERELDRCEEGLLKLLSECDESLDVIVLPEYSDVLADVKGVLPYYEAVRKYSPTVIEAAKETAKRCSATVFVNAGYECENGIRNTTHVISRDGEVVGRYFKAHPAPSEVKGEGEGGHGLDVGYSYEMREPYVIEHEGLRYAFMTCYDFYFYEAYARLALEGVDIVIGCSLQRTDTQEALGIINRHLAYHTNAYLIRSSVSLGEKSTLCGTSSVVAPDGEVLIDMKSKVGLGTVEIDPKKKYYKPAGHAGLPKSHYEYIEEGRRPWLYRNAGPSVIPDNLRYGYPRLCAHRGLSRALPENTLPALGAAVALGAPEVEFDVRLTKDKVLVVAHDERLDRISDGVGNISDYTYLELLRFDFGKGQEGMKSLRIATLEEVLLKLSGRVIMNIHVKLWDEEREEPMVEEIVRLVRKYDAVRYVYFMTTSDKYLHLLSEYAPDIALCVGWDGDRDPMSIIKRAERLGIGRVQLFKPYFNSETVREARRLGIITNVFYADDPKEAKEYLDLGIDVILTNDFSLLSGELSDYFKK